MTTCFLCETELTPYERGLWQHPEAEFCYVKFTDGFGIAVDETLAMEAVEEKPENEPSEFFSELDIRLFPFVEEVLDKIFAEAGLVRLGGVSSGRGWSAFSTWQRCPYLYYRRYVQPVQTSIIVPPIEPEARAIGTVIHTFLAIYYQRMIVPDYPLTPEFVRDELIKVANPEIVNEGWRVFLAYALYYQDEPISPLAIEYDLKDPRTGESCRFDLIAYFKETHADRLPGTYVLEHKSASRFDDATLNGWANDGEVLGQVMLWERLGLQYRFGPLRGVIVNILGKQKEPKFHRTTVAPESWQCMQHKSDLKLTEAAIQTARATGVFPRFRAGCINRFGKCDLWENCATVKD